MTLMYPRVRLLLMVVGLGFGFINGAQAAGAGRAFPIESENYVIDKFQRINPNLEWDRTNFLTDLSGQYANCALISRGTVGVSRKTPEGDSIGGYNDYEDGTGFHVDAVIDDLKIVIDRWNKTRVLHHQIMVARRFGCSVRPGCSGQVAVNCLFSPADDGIWPTRSSTTRQSTQPSITRQSTQPSTTSQHIQQLTSPQDIRSKPLHSSAQALTPEQYKDAEWFIGNKWDRYLENLSGFETNCTMIGRAHWPFTQAETHKPKGPHIVGKYGHAKNEGSTQDALENILKEIGLMTVHMSSSRKFGCSLIPDCRLPNGTLYVVVSCIFQDY